MGKYNFDDIINRRNTLSLKWDVKENELPMWVADMDFTTAPEIISAMEERVKHGVFGYSIIDDEWAMSYINWWKERHNLSMKAEELVFCTGVIPAISSAVRKLTTPGEKVIVQTPVYNIFFNSIVNNGRFILENPLKYDGNNYEMDFADLEKKLSDPQASLMLLCNPQNPAGKIWDRDTLAKVGSLCKKYGVTVVSDEIHCDIVRPGMEYVPFASASEECREISVTCMAPTKCFNIAGIQTAAIYVPNPFLRHKMWRALNTDEVAEPNSFAINVAKAAFNNGKDWLCELNEYLFENRRFAEEYIEKNIPELKAVKSDATYLIWIDGCRLFEDSEDFTVFLREKTGLYITEGSEYGNTGKQFVRMNLACSKKVLGDGLDRLCKGVKLYSEEKRQR